MIRHRGRTTAVVAALVAGLAVPVFATHPIPAPFVYRVRPGTTVVACGGFAFRCEVWQLRGTLEVFFEFHDDEGVIGPNIISSHLELVTAGGHATPFPHGGDLPLTALEGSTEAGGRLRFVSPAGSLQTVELTLTSFVRDLERVEGQVLDGFYDEGCCDRYRIDLGNVVLLPDRGVASLDLHDGRFHVVARWRASGERSGEGQPVTLDRASGYFWFFQPDNPEVFVKILDACIIKGRYWLFAGGLTNLDVEITFVDDRSDGAIVASNPLGQSFATFIDTTGFACNPPPPGG